MTPPLTLAERIFLRLYCYRPPAVPFEPRDLEADNPPPMPADPLKRLRIAYGAKFHRAIAGQVLLDIGCGPGDQVLAAAQAGCRLAVGVDRREPVLQIGADRARAMGLAGSVQFTVDAAAAYGRRWADVVLSLNSFEHFEEPDQILAQAYDALKPGGQFFITFGPSWWHPYGVHHMFMIRLPWAHCIFSEQTILRVRQLYRPDRPATWREVSLNRMTVAKLLELIRASGFSLSLLSMTPIRPLPRWLVQLRLFREWTSSHVSVILTKPSGSTA